ncbi:hypothetical protein ACJZ2D_002170 [Fusarium nematophilum]
MATAFPPTSPTALPTSAVDNAPWIVQILHENNTDELQHLIAPILDDTPNIRSTLDILQSCVLTLVACIYTALHLDVPKKTKGATTLAFQAEMGHHNALKTALREEYKKQNPGGETETNGDENQEQEQSRYASEGSGSYPSWLDVFAGNRSTDYGPAHFTSGDSYLCPCRVRRDSLLLLVHFGEDEHDEELKGEIAVRIQRQFYCDMQDKLALFPPERDFDSPAPGPPDGFPGRLRWVVPNPGVELQPGDILVSGLAYCPKDGISDALGVEEEPSNGEPRAQGVYLEGLLAFDPDDRKTFRNMPFCEGKRNLDINIKALMWGSWGIGFTQELLFAPFKLFKEFPGLAVLAVALLGIYGGVHSRAGTGCSRP